MSSRSKRNYKMLNLKTPHGLDVKVPELDKEDLSPKFVLNQLDEIKKYYNEEGYVVLKGVIAEEICDKARSLWEEEVKPFKGFIYRQAGTKAEKNLLNDHGWIMNPILNLQSLDPKFFNKLRSHAVNKVFTNPNLKKVFTTILEDKPKIVQSMYFEGNSATWEHQDSYYLDSERIGTMSAAWIALEDIKPEAGRFFVCPKSHLIDSERQNLENNIADRHDYYISQIIEKITEKGLEIRAPKLNKGDVLLWNAWTIHGSLKSDDTSSSRSSITCHAIANNDSLIQRHSRIKNIQCDNVNEVSIYRPKDQAKFLNKVVISAESNFPGIFYYLKYKAVKFLIKRKN
jgi:phytanoyl-CoA hydroxylase